MKILRIYFSLLAVIALFSFSGCDKVDDLTKFDMEYNSTITIPSANLVGIGGVLNFGTPDITTNSENTFKNNNTDADLVESVKLKSMILTIDSPVGEDFSFVKSIKLFIKADGLPRRQLASKSDISNIETTLELAVDDVELREYLLKNEFSIDSEITTDEVVDQEYKINVNTVFRVDAKILGV